jgi:hypothetical protein
MSMTTRYAAITGTLSALSSITMYAAIQADPNVPFIGVMLLAFVVAVLSFGVAAFATGDM